MTSRRSTSLRIALAGILVALLGACSNQEHYEARKNECVKVDTTKFLWFIPIVKNEDIIDCAWVSKR